MMMSIRNWPLAERPREKLLLLGAKALSDAELLAIFLRVGRPGCSAVGMARELLNEFGDLRQVLSADQAQICAIKGFGDSTFVTMQAALELARRHYQIGLKRREILSSPAPVKTFLLAELRDYQQEIFAVVFLDTQNQLLRFEHLSVGTLNNAMVYSREIVKRALKVGAASVILAHNHPSGVSKPSPADIEITHKLSQALALVDIRVLDHFIIGDGHIFSFAEQGLL